MVKVKWVCMIILKIRKYLSDEIKFSFFFWISVFSRLTDKEYYSSNKLRIISGLYIVSAEIWFWRFQQINIAVFHNRIEFVFPQFSIITWDNCLEPIFDWKNNQLFTHYWKYNQRHCIINKPFRISLGRTSSGL